VNFNQENTMTDKKTPDILRQDEVVEQISRQTGLSIGDFVPGRTSVGKTEAAQQLGALIEGMRAESERLMAAAPGRVEAHPFVACGVSDPHLTNFGIHRGDHGELLFGVLDFAGDPAGYQGYDGGLLDRHLLNFGVREGCRIKRLKKRAQNDRHLLNFGVREGEDGKLIFELNDFIEEDKSSTS
jgi:hypothetical protein